jgi:hypothetical protein
VIAQRWTTGWTIGGSGVRFPVGTGNFSLHHRVENGSGAHPASYPMGTSDSLAVKWPGREADHTPPSSVEFKEWVELYIHSPNTPSWSGAPLKKQRDNFTFYFLFLKYFEHFSTKCINVPGSSVSIVTSLRDVWPWFISRQGQWWDAVCQSYERQFLQLWCTWLQMYKVFPFVEY